LRWILTAALLLRGAGVVAFAVEHVGQVRKGEGGVAVLRAEPLPPDGQRFTVQWLGFGQLRLAPGARRRATQAHRQLGAVGRQQPPMERQRLASQVFGGGIVARGVQDPAQRVHRARDLWMLGAVRLPCEPTERSACARARS
jgi:hypothetical protein